MSQSGKHFVFLDHSGRRWPRLKILGVGVTILLGTGLFLFLGSLFIAPPLPSPLNIMKGEIRTLQRRHPEGQTAPAPLWLKYTKTRQSREAKKEPSLRIPPTASRALPTPTETRLAYYVDWDPQSLQSLRIHAPQLTHVATENFVLRDVGGKMAVHRNPEVEEFLKENHLHQLAELTNFDGKQWVPEAVEYLAFGPQAHRDAFFSQLTDALSVIGTKGILIDWEQIDPTYEDEVTVLLHQMAKALHQAGQELWLTVPVGDDLNAFDLPQLADAVDRFVAVLHDENGQEDSPGPIASPDWFDGWLKALLGGTDPAQWVVELGSYGYDWGRSSEQAEEISFADAMTRARYSGAEDVAVQAPDFNPSFSYSENGHDHTVWFLDAVTFYNQLRAAESYGVKNFALNRLGEEDPGIWGAFDLPRDRPLAATALTELGRIPSGERITHIGEGEIVTLENLDQTPGSRHTSQKGNQELTASYEKFPAFPTLVHDGDGGPRRVALTFDDGPDPHWTPQILDLLRQYHVHATFFVVGSNAEKYPSLLRRIVNEGHEIGSHTFTHANLAEVPDRQVSLELNATLRVIQNATGYATQLFRPPYNADSRPENVAELRPLEIAQGLGYLTVLEQIDPQDWSRPGTDEIVQRVKEQMGHGSIILLHDAGGNRHETVEALPRILENLQQSGVAVVSLADLLGTTDGQLMPPVAAKENQALAFAVSGVGFWLMRILENSVWFLVVTATILVAARTLLILVLALCHWRKERPLGNFAPPLSIIVPAYQEGKVIAATLESLLACDYPAPLEILVIDDGSPDHTAAEVRRIAQKDPRVRLLEQPNRGKAAALENGVAHAENEILVFLDADTHFERDTLRHLVSPLEDERVGAVAGNPRVGNLRSLMAKCQDIEYLVAFNLERRALSHWNAVTVVPGAVSAFRRRAIAEAGGFRHDTLAEDTDLTLAIHEAGWRVDCAPKAIARTEAPETVRTLVKQRFRWALGTMQCVWKHRRQTFSRQNPALGWFSLPGIWVFQVALVATAPLIDLLFIQSAVMGHWDVVLPYFSVFLVSDLLLALVACRMEGTPLTRALWILPMRFIYRPVLSYVIWKAIFAALRGVWVGWGKLDRTGTVSSAASTATA